MPQDFPTSHDYSSKVKKRYYRVVDIGSEYRWVIYSILAIFFLGIFPLVMPSQFQGNWPDRHHEDLSGKPFIRKR
jgi:hypothetical protein